MSDTSAPAPQSNDGPQLRALSQYVKDLSFENPGNRTADDRPNIDLGIDVSAIPHEQGNGLYEISLKLNAKAHTASNTLFLIELDYGGVFQVLGMPEAEAEAALLIECPRMLFPFARRLIADITREGGFPPLLIDPVDFVQLYRSQKQRDQGAAAGAAPTPQPPQQPQPPQSAAPVAPPSQPGQPAQPIAPGQPGQPMKPTQN
ncbi:MAG: protein-export chaperone SecB [Hyphomonadaceae bacterium]|nr:protein-export chaperone SecB [Hyphomonadaceae bacterium]